MYARVAHWEGGEAKAMHALVTQIKESDGPPEGVPAKGVTVLMDPDGGRAMVITFYESEEDRRTADETFNGMNPPDEALGRRSGVDMYEVGIEAHA